MHLVAAFCMLWQDAVLPVIRDVKAVAQMANGVDYLTSGILEFKGGARASLSAGMILGVEKPWVSKEFSLCNMSLMDTVLSKAGYI